MNIENDSDLQKHPQPFRRHRAIGEWDCKCVQVDVDESDARGCPLHGPQPGTPQTKGTGGRGPVRVLQRAGPVR